MMINKVCFSVWLMAFSLVSSLLSAQYNNPSRLAANAMDTVLKPSIDWKTKTGKNHFALRPYLLPSIMIAYGVVSLHTDALADINETLKEEIYTERLPHKTSIDNYLQYAPAATIYLLNAAGIHGLNNFWDRTIIYGISNLILGTTVYATKHGTKEPRPDGSNNLSFPSGHTATAFAAAEFLRREYKLVSPWYGIAGYAAAAATGYLRLSNNKHWAGDIVAGAGFGLISTKLAYWVYPAIKHRLFRDKPANTIVLPVYQNGCWGLGLARQL